MHWHFHLVYFFFLNIFNIHTAIYCQLGVKCCTITWYLKSLGKKSLKRTHTNLTCARAAQSYCVFMFMALLFFTSSMLSAPLFEMCYIQYIKPTDMM